MKNTIKLVSAFLLLVFISSCNSDDDTVPEDFVVAFSAPSVSFSADENEKEIALVFSTAAPETGTVSISFTGTNAVYGNTEDFITEPAAVDGVITIPLTSGTMSTSFTFKKLKNAIEGTEKTIDFKITTISVANGMISGTVATQVAFEETAALGGSVAVEVGGPNEANQVYVDLSGQAQTAVSRDLWDLAFYNGTDFRVAINGSVFMAAAALEDTDIDAVTAAGVADLQAAVAVGTFDAANVAYIDAPDGDITTLAIGEVSATDAENKVYLVNMGAEIGTETPAAGSVAVSGDSRGWMKIRVLRNGEGYTLQYAALDDATHTEVSISKNTDYNFQYFSLVSKKEVNVAPKKDKWDLDFTVFTNVIDGFGSYGYSDFVAANRESGVEGYVVEVETKAYQDFSLADIDDTAFSKDQRFIGSNWRNGGGPGALPSLKEEVYFILKDADGNVYKLKFTALVNESGVRGNPAFEYALLD